MKSVTKLDVTEPGLAVTDLTTESLTPAMSIQAILYDCITPFRSSSAGGLHENIASDGEINSNPMFRGGPSGTNKREEYQQSHQLALY